MQLRLDTTVQQTDQILHLIKHYGRLKPNNQSIYIRDNYDERRPLWRTRNKPNEMLNAIRQLLNTLSDL